LPPAYSIIRAAKAKLLNAGRLGVVVGLDRTPSFGKIGYGKGGLVVQSDGRSYQTQNYHCTDKGLNMSVSLRRPIAGAADDMACLACPNSHSFADRMEREGLPIVVIVSDQHFPPILPAANGDCAVIIRVEDGLLPELECAFTDRLKTFLKPHGRLTPGSVVLVGSLSHLHAKGLADYTDSLVRVVSGIGGKVGPNVDVIPLVNIPMHDLLGPSLVRNMLDFDSWLLAGQGGISTVLPNTRAAFWATIANGENHVTLTESHTIVMPTSLRNPRKRPMTSDPFTRPIPSSLLAADEETEGKLVTGLFTELNDVYGLGLDICLDMTRGPVPVTDHGRRRTAIVGASHMCRLMAAMTDAGTQVINLCTPGWKGSKDNLTKIADCIREEKLCEDDILIMDLWSNVAFMGTNEAGLPSHAVKNVKDGKYHLMGQLQAAPKTVFRAVLADAAGIVEAAGSAKIFLVAPIARYVMGKCCNDPTHVVNFGTEDLYSEVYRAADISEAALAASPLNDSCSIFHVLENLSSSDSDLSEVRTASGESAWRAGDPVHLTEAAYAEAAAALLALAATDNELQQAAKRPRLSSVVPVAPGQVSRGARAPVGPTPWVAGVAARERGGYTRGGGGWSFRVNGGRGGYGGNGRAMRSRPYRGGSYY
jgi:hypothetical protein